MLKINVCSCAGMTTQWRPAGDTCCWKASIRDASPATLLLFMQYFCIISYTNALKRSKFPVTTCNMRSSSTYCKMYIVSLGNPQLQGAMSNMHVKTHRGFLAHAASSARYAAPAACPCPCLWFGPGCHDASPHQIAHPVHACACCNIALPGQHEQPNDGQQQDPLKASWAASFPAGITCRCRAACRDRGPCLGRDLGPCHGPCRARGCGQSRACRCCRRRRARPRAA